MYQHFLYFPTQAQAQNFVRGSEVLAGTAEYAGTYESTRFNGYYALYKSKQKINSQDTRVISDESELYGCTRSYFNE